MGRDELGVFICLFFLPLPWHYVSCTFSMPIRDGICLTIWTLVFTYRNGKDTQKIPKEVGERDDVGERAFIDERL